MLDTQTFTSLPFPIALTDGGYTISRRGEPPKEETGTRVFIVDTSQLRALYESETTDPEQVYEALKHMDKGGRLLCLGDDPVQLDRTILPEWTLIVKKIEHPHKNHWKTPDVLRLDIVPDTTDTLAARIVVNQRIVETESAFLGSEPLNITNLTRDCPLHFVEPWIYAASQADQTAFEERMQKINATDEQREGAIDQFDRVRLVRRPNTNTVLLRSLRDHIGTIPAPPIEGHMVQDLRTGEISVRIDRSEGLYDRIMAMSLESEARAAMLLGLPIGMTLETLANDSYGVNGIESDNTVYLFHGSNHISVPMLPPHADRGTLIFYFGAHTIHRRKAMILNVERIKGQIFASVTAGIEEGEHIDYGTSSARTVFSHEQHFIRDQARIRATLSEKTAQQQREENEMEKRKREEHEMRKANPFAYADTAAKSIYATLQR